ncbi:hypothetical protein KQI34_07670 [Anaerobutyricum soehngenii]|nr:hypothetical protein [Anaerobutyricum soehngenii]
MHRGVRRSAIFEDETDYQVMLQMIKDCLEKYQCILYAYCLMTNQIRRGLTLLQNKIVKNVL